MRFLAGLILALTMALPAAAQQSPVPQPPTSPGPGRHVATSLIAFMLAYAFVFTAGAVYVLRLIAAGPDAANAAAPEPTGQAFPAAPGHGLGDAP